MSRRIPQANQAKRMKELDEEGLKRPGPDPLDPTAKTEGWRVNHKRVERIWRQVFEGDCSPLVEE